MEKVYKGEENNLYTRLYLLCNTKAKPCTTCSLSKADNMQDVQVRTQLKVRITQINIWLVLKTASEATHLSVYNKKNIIMIHLIWSL